MNDRSFKARISRTLIALALGGSAFQLSGCDPQVRSTLLGGLETTSQGLASSLVSAFFLTLAPSDTAGALTTTAP